MPIWAVALSSPEATPRWGAGAASVPAAVEAVEARPSPVPISPNAVSSLPVGTPTSGRKARTRQPPVIRANPPAAVHRAESSGDQPGPEEGADDHGQVQGREVERGPAGRQPQRVLHVEHRQVHGGRGRRGHRGGHQVRAAHGADGEQVGGQQRVGAATGAAEHGHQHGRPEQQRTHDAGRVGGDRGRLGRPVDDRGEAERDPARLDGVQAPRALPRHPRQHRHDQREDREPDRHVDPEHPPPVAVLGQRAAQQPAGGPAARGRRGPHPDRASTAGTGFGARGEQREGRRGQQRGRRTLRRPRGEQQLGATRPVRTAATCR